MDGDVDPYMNRADGFPLYVPSVGGSTYDPQTGAITGGSSTLVDGHTQQWLYYQVVVGTQLASGAWHWDYGNWMRRKEQLGGHTDGQTTEVFLNGTWVRTDYSMVGYYNGSVWVSYPTDASIFTGNSPAGWKYVYGHMYWGPIDNVVSGRRVFAPYEHWEPLGMKYCS